MRAFQIESIAYGWLEVRMGKYHLIASDYLSADTPRLLLQALLRLAGSGSEEEWLCWPDEPGAVIMRLSREETRLCLECFHALRGSYFLPDAGPGLRDACGESWGTLREEAASLLEDIVTAFSLYENGNGRALYEAHWMPFPEEAYDALKVLARSVAHEKPFFDTY